ncbi:MAG: DMT family transporter [Gemmatimonadetes bacterium]|nr:DMT family transporter [Gemmatimonadota bacterium]MBT7861605.1 DMT family transporter [Gemmatimonadota bacterium]
MSKDLKYSLYVLLSALAGAAGLLTTEIAVRSMGIRVIHVAISANLVAGTLLLGWAAFRGGRRWFGWGRADWIRLLLGAAATYAAGFLLLYEAIGFIGTSKASLLGRLETIFIVLLAVIFLREPWTRRHWLGGLMALAGTALVNFDPGAWTLDLGWGELLAVVSALTFAVGIILLKSVLDRQDGLLVTGYGMMLGALILSIFFTNGSVGSDTSSAGGVVLAVLFGRGILLAISWIAYNVAMQYIGASRCSVLFLSISFMAILLQVSVDAVAPGLGLQLPTHLGLAVLGGVVICAGIYFIPREPATDQQRPTGD